MASETIETLRTQIKEMRDKGLLPKGYAKKVAQQLGKGYNENKVYQFFTGNNSSVKIIEALIELAEQSKVEELAKRATKILKEE